MTTLDADDEAVYAHAFLLADTLRRFLERRYVRKWLKLWTDDPVVVDLIAQSQRMTELRQARLDNARQETR